LFKTFFSEIYRVEAVVGREEGAKKDAHYIKLTMESPDVSGQPMQPVRRPLIQCDSDVIAKKVCNALSNTVDY
jgi:hypothetical protein